MADADTQCGIGIRGVAVAIDGIPWLAAFFLATWAVAAATGQLETGAASVDAELSGTPGLAAFGLWIGLGVAYHAVLEWWAGQTVGKYLVSIRVVATDGTPVSGRAAVLRNLLRVVDFLPVFYLVGIAVMLFADEATRLGDLVADTRVVR